MIQEPAHGERTRFPAVVLSIFFFFFACISGLLS